MKLKLKLSTRTWTLIGVGVLLVITLIVWTYRTKQIKQQSQITNDLHQVTSRLAALEIDEVTAQQQRLQEQIDSISITLGQPEYQAATTTDSITASGKLYEIAGFSSVEIIDIGAESSRSDKLEGIPCTVVQVDLTAQGPWQNLLYFVERLKDDFTVSRVNQIDLIIPTDPEEGFPTVRVSLLVYTYGGTDA